MIFRTDGHTHTRTSRNQYALPKKSWEHKNNWGGGGGGGSGRGGGVGWWGRGGCEPRIEGIIKIT